MASQKSTPRDPLPPTRQRGRARVRAIMDAAAAIFAARGFDAATMTEIAAASDTAIGSLYRFFPNKELLADAVFGRYADTVSARLEALLPLVAGADADALAELLLRSVLERGFDRDAAAALADSRPDGAALRRRLRDRIRRGLAAALERAGFGPERAGRMAPVVLHLLKGLSRLTADGFDEAAVFAELRRLLALYLDAARGVPADGSASRVRTAGTTSTA